MSDIWDPHTIFWDPKGSRGPSSPALLSSAWSFSLSQLPSTHAAPPDRRQPKVPVFSILGVSAATERHLLQCLFSTSLQGFEPAARCQASAAFHDLLKPAFFMPSKLVPPQPSFTTSLSLTSSTCSLVPLSQPPWADPEETHP